MLTITKQQPSAASKLLVGHFLEGPETGFFTRVPLVNLRQRFDIAVGHGSKKVLPGRSRLGYPTP
ncbi:MAG: hypothetical protein KDA55_18975 [Planctomycetales bacterium]|nr:hypothetical protein [Planctomycetales bacterium]